MECQVMHGCSTAGKQVEGASRQKTNEGEDGPISYVMRGGGEGGTNVKERVGHTILVRQWGADRHL
jgi:hypothetical protein